MSTDRTTVALMHRIEDTLATGRTPVLTGNTADLFTSSEGPIFDLPHLLAMAATSHGRTLVTFSLAHGSRDLNPMGAATPSGLRHVLTDEGAANALTDLLEQLAATDGPLWLLVDYSDLLLPSAPGGDTGSRDHERVIELLSEQALRQSSGRTPHRLLIVARAGSGIDTRLTAMPSFASTPVPLPDTAERRAALTRLIAPDAVGGPLVLEDGFEVDEAAVLTGGMSTFDLVQARQRWQRLGQPFTRAHVQESKSAAIEHRSGGNLTVVPPGNGLADVAGLPAVRLMLNEYRATGIFPQRVLFTGPPGVGKSIVVRSIGDHMGVPVVRFGNFRSQWVGETERQLTHALSTVESLAPCVVWIDEIDLEMGRREEGPSGDSGLSARLMATLWGWLSERRGSERIYVLATTNRPDSIDSALTDRFELVPVLHPTAPEGAEVMRIVAARSGLALDPRLAEEAIRAYGQLVTGRMLERVTEKAITIAGVDGSAVLERRHVMAAFEELLSPVPTSQHEHLGLLALSTTTFASRLPWVAARRIGEEPHVPYYVEPFIASDGRFDSDALAEHLSRHGRGRTG